MNKIILPFLISFLFLVSLVSASVTVVTTSSSVTKATTGTSVTISCSVTASSSETTSLQLISSPSGITITDPSSGSYSSVSVSTTPTTKTFTITAGTANTYSYYAQAGSTTSSSASIVFVEPSTLTVTGSPASVTKNSGETFTLSISISNSQSDAITTSYALTLPSGYSASGDQTSNTITVGASSTTNLQWTITAGSASGTISFQLGSNTNAFSSAVTVPTTTTTTTAVASGGGSTGSTAVETGKVTKTFTSITELTPKTITESQLADSKTKLTEIYIAVANRITDVSITIEKLAGKPNETATVSNAYEYIKITTKNLVNISQTKIKFKVAKSWVNSNNIDVSTIALYRYTTSWEKLETNKISEDSTYYYFEAETPAFSYFAIGGEKAAGVTTTTTLATTTTVPAATTTTTPLPAIVPGIPTAYIVIAVFIIVFVMLLIVFFKGRI